MPDHTYCTAPNCNTRFDADREGQLQPALCCEHQHCFKQCPYCDNVHCIDLEHCAECEAAFQAEQEAESLPRCSVCGSQLKTHEVADQICCGCDTNRTLTKPVKLPDMFIGAAWALKATYTNQ
jgi:hypothetical protein